MSRNGWTLLELIVVVALMAVIAAGAIVTVRAPLAAGRIQADVDAALLADRLARSHAVRFAAPAELHYRIGSPSTLTVDENASDTGTPRQLGTLVEVRQPGETRTTNTITIPMSADGRTPTYGLRFRDSRDNDVWIVVAGGTGQPLTGLTSQDAYALLQAE